MTIAFNVAPRHFDDALILNDVGTIFDGSKIRLSQIVLELTERHEVDESGRHAPHHRGAAAGRLQGRHR